jgi:type III secretion protein U
MAEKNDGADKTELPTQKRLRDARKKGDVAKSKDLSAGLLTLTWLILFALASGYVATQIGRLTTTIFASATSTTPFEQTATAAGWDAMMTLISVSFVVLVPVAVIATFAEYMQAGPIFTLEKMKFGLDKLNPMEGLKRMFGKDGLFELVKTLIKVALIGVIATMVLKTALSESGQLIRLASPSPLANAGPAAATATLDLTYSLTIQLFSLIVAVFLLVAVADRLYAKSSYIKKMKMSRRDIKQEYKDDEGDPQIKSMRREMHQEWANSNAAGATRGASALLVNPTHISIALDYDVDTCPVPVIAAKGAGPLAATMRAEAEAHGVPIIRNIATARSLWARGEVGEIVPEDMFDAIAAIILWAGKARDGDAPMWQDMDSAQRPLLRAPAPATTTAAAA